MFHKTRCCTCTAATEQEGDCLCENEIPLPRLFQWWCTRLALPLVLQLHIASFLCYGLNLAISISDPEHGYTALQVQITSE